MRTLKKTLCLVLCLAMLAGLCAVSAFAAFKDDAEIVNKEAVEVLAGVGVINGMDNGNFAPKGTLTRAQACKIIAFLLGDEDVKAACNFEDCKGHWAADYIAYCAAKGIVNGVGDNKFAPDAELTGSAWAKMVLAALGYNADAEKMTGASWEVGVGALVKKLNLTAGLKAFDGTKAISREDACQVAFNALTKEMVAYDNGGVTIKTADVEITTGASAAKGTGEYLGDGLDIVVAGKLNKVDGVDENGYAYYEYYKTTDAKNPITSKFYTEKVLGEYGAGKSAKDICKDQGITAKNVKDAKVTLVVNGKEKGEYALKDYVADTTKLPANTSAVLAQSGKNYKLVVTVEYLVKAKLGAKVTDKNDDNYGLYAWTFGGYTAAVIYGEKDEYVKDAKYLVVPENDNMAAEKFLSIAEPDVVTGTVTAKGTGYVKLGDEKLVLACADSTNFTDSFDFYLYTSGQVAEIAVHEEKIEEVALNNVYVIAVAAKAAKGGAEDMFETTAVVPAVAQAKVIDLATGEIKIVTVGTVAKDGKYYYADKNGKASAEEVADKAMTAVNKIYSVAVLDDGAYVLVDAVALQHVKLVKKSADIGVAGKLANSATVVTKVELTKKAGEIKSAAISSKTGIANFAGEDVDAVVVANKSGVVTSILYVTDYVAPEVKNYAIYMGAGETDKDGTKLAFFQNGEKVEYYGAALDKGALYELTVAAGKVTAAAKVGVAAADKAVTVVDDTFMVAGGATLYFADKCTVVSLTDGVYAEDEIAVDDIVTYYVDGDGKVFYAIITGEVE